jgi:hypothetical protein
MFSTDLGLEDMKESSMTMTVRTRKSVSNIADETHFFSALHCWVQPTPIVMSHIVIFRIDDQFRENTLIIEDMRSF